MGSRHFFCTDCYWHGYSEKIKTRGSFAAEVVVWGVFIAAAFKLGWLFFLPALLYSAWRLTGRKAVCPGCEHDALIPIESPRAQSMILSYTQEQEQQEQSEPLTEADEKERLDNQLFDDVSTDNFTFYQKPKRKPGPPGLNKVSWAGIIFFALFLALGIFATIRNYIGIIE